MRARAVPRPRPVSGLDLAAKAASVALPRALTPAVDQLRHDARAILDQASGHREPPCTDARSGPRPLQPLGEVSVVQSLLPRRMGDRVRQLQRDVRVVRDRLRGRRAPFLVARQPRPQLEPAPSPRRRGIVPRPVEVVKVVRETPNAVSLYLRERGGAPLAFEPGQFLSFDVEVDGRVLRRAYSLASPALEGHEPHVTVKRVAGGRVSNYLNDHAEPGMVLDVLGPSGSFVVEPGANERRLVLIAGGSGITPIASIAETTLAVESTAHVTLLYGNASEEEIIFRDRLDELAARHPERMHLVHVLENAGEAWSGPRGRLDGPTLMDRLGALSHADEAHTLYYVCGPSGMMDAAREALVAAGVDPARIHEERFSRPEDRVQVGPDLGPQPVTFRLGREGREVQVTTDGETLLEAGLAAGLPLAFSCAMGGCAACKVEVTSGQVVMEEPNCLTQAERDRGEVLACVARAASPCTVEVQ